MPTDYNQLAGRQVERIAALTDGLFAIAMTLIVLEVKVPEHAVGAAVYDRAPGRVHHISRGAARLLDQRPALWRRRVRELVVRPAARPVQAEAAAGDDSRFPDAGDPGAAALRDRRGALCHRYLLEHRIHRAHS